MQEQRVSRMFCDIILKCGQSKLDAHRTLLASCSPYFGNILSERTATPIVEIRDIDESTFVKLIDYIYTGKVQITPRNVKNLMTGAHKWQLHELIEACSEFLQTRLHPSNWHSILRVAEALECRDLQLACLNFASEHLDELIDGDNSLPLVQENQLIRIISMEQLSEDTRLKAIVLWVTYEPTVRDRAVPRLCDFVRVGGLSRRYLSHLLGDRCMSTTNLAAFIRRASRSQQENTEISTPISVSNAGEHGSRRPIPIIMVAGGYKCEPSVASYPLDKMPSASNTQHSNAFNSPKIPALPVGKHGCAAVVVYGMVYVIGGVSSEGNCVQSVHVLDLSRMHWKQGTPMQAKRCWLGATKLNGKIYAVGGSEGGQNILNTAEVFDPSTNRWRFIANMLQRRWGCGVATMNGKLYVVGGLHETQLSSVEVYQPGTDSWTSVIPMFTGREDVGTCVLGNMLYAVGGCNAHNEACNSGEFYNPETETWQPIAPMNERRRGHGLVAHGGFLYALGGDDGSGKLTSVERYDPRSNRWVTLPDKLDKSRIFAAFAVINYEPSTR